MIQLHTVLTVADNSGAKKVKCIHVLGGTGRRYARVGDKIKISIKEAYPNTAIKKGQVKTAVVVRTKKELGRKNGTFLRSDNNAAVLINDKGEPVGTRIFGPVSRELRSKNYMKIVSLAPEVY